MSIPCSGIFVLTVLLVHLSVPLTTGQNVKSEWGEWSSWSSCSVTCGYGSIQKVKYLFDENGRKTNESYVQHSSCYLAKKCPIHGNWTMWSPYSTCSMACGPGFRTRRRTCTNPIPGNGGRDCYGAGEQLINCNLTDCPPIPPNFNLTSCEIGDIFWCKSKRMCVLKKERCDREVQCHDGSDEYQCYKYSGRASGIHILKTFLILWTLFIIFLTYS